MSLENEWEIFKKAVIGPGASQVQYDEMEKAFYGGAATVFTLMTDAAQGDEEEEGAGKMKALYEEIGAFSEEMREKEKE